MVIVNTVELLILIMTCFRPRERRAVLAGVKAMPLRVACGQP
jgi:hypothetical protein